MKRVYKIIVLFLIIFLIGVISFMSYINYTMDKNEESRAAITTQKSSAKDTSKASLYY